MKKVIAKIKCLLITGHMMEKYTSKLVDKIFSKGKIHAFKSRCRDCGYLPDYWVAEERGPNLPVMYH